MKPETRAKKIAVVLNKFISATRAIVDSTKEFLPICTLCQNRFWCTTHSPLWCLSFHVKSFNQDLLEIIKYRVVCKYVYSGNRKNRTTICLSSGALKKRRLGLNCNTKDKELYSKMAQ